MRKVFWIAAFGVVALGLSGALGTAMDFGTIAWNTGVRKFEGAVPIGLDIERFKLSIDQLNTQIENSARKMAEESVAIDRFAGEIDAKSKGLAQIKSELRGLKSKYVCTENSESKSSLEGAMATRVARYGAQTQALQSMQTALEHRREAFQKLASDFDDQKSTRDVLQGKLESMQAEYTSMKMRGELGSHALDRSAVRKATDLAIKIADRLEVERRISSQSFDRFESYSGNRNPAEVILDMASVDAILGCESTVASR
jgi:chromosome segregation ATPase